MLPLTLATMLLLFDVAEYAPEPPDTFTCTLPEQSVSVTLLGVAVSGPLGTGQVPDADPVVLTDTGVFEVPSETVIVALATPAEGLTRRTVSTLPWIVALTLALLEAAL